MIQSDLNFAHATTVQYLERVQIKDLIESLFYLTTARDFERLGV